MTVNGHVEGGGGINSAIIQGGLKVASVRVLGNLVGGVGDGSGSIAATEIDTGLNVLPGDLGKVIIGGNIEAYAEACEQARREAYRRMVRHAEEEGADAIVAMRYDATEFAQSTTEVLAYGTAVKLSRG